MRIVTCTSDSGLTVPCNTNVCAERRLVAALRRSAYVHGVPKHSVAKWVRRRAGTLTVERRTSDGAQACSLPCILCRRVLDAFDLRWRATAWDGTVVTRDEAPPPRFTHRQRNTMFPYVNAQ